MKGEKIYLSTRFYTNHPFKELKPEMELRGLQYLLGRMVEQEKYEVAELVKHRIHKVQQQQLIIESWQFILRKKNWSLN